MILKVGADGRIVVVAFFMVGSTQQETYVCTYIR